jgi:HAD superfamily hydrolase (TIGR01509 family)
MAADRARRTRAVLFDYGLTLVTYRFPRDCLVAMLERLRREIVRGSDRDPGGEALLEAVLLPIEAKLPALGEGEDEIDYLAFYRECWNEAGYPVTEALAYRLLDAEQRCWEAAVEPATGMFHVLHSLRAAGLRTAICSNAPFPPEMHRQVAALGIADLMDAVVFSSQVGRRKPAPEPYLAALAAVGVAADAALFVGDRVLEDYDGPRRVGMRALLCTALAQTAAPPGVPAIAELGELEAWL